MLTLFKQGGSDFSAEATKMLDERRRVPAQLAVHPLPAGDPNVLINHFAHRIKLIWVQKEIGFIRKEINSRKRAGKIEDHANLIRRLADLHREEVLLKQPNLGMYPESGWMEGGTRHAEKG